LTTSLGEDPNFFGDDPITMIEYQVIWEKVKD